MIDEFIWRRWGNIAKRLESIANKQRSGYCVATLTILIGPDGAPHFWTSPSVVQLEPKNVSVSDILRLLGNSPQLILTDASRVPVEISNHSDTT